MLYNPNKIVSSDVEVGIIPHYVDYDNIVRLYGNKYNVIDVRNDPEKVIMEISRCRRIISSSLHGIIISEALGKPSAFVRFSNKVVGGEFKFMDYYLGSGREEGDVYCNDCTMDQNIEDIRYCEKRPVYDIDSLLKTFPYEIEQYKIDLIHRWFEK